MEKPALGLDIAYMCAKCDDTSNQVHTLVKTSVWICCTVGAGRNRL